MGKKETIAVMLLCSLTTILKICSIVALYHAKTYDRIPEEPITALNQHTLCDDVLLAGDAVATIKPEQEDSFKQTFFE